MSKRGRPPKAVLYARVLPRTQRGVLHLSAKVQLERLARFAADRRWVVAGEFVDTPEHPGCPGLIEAVSGMHTGGYLVVNDVSRLGGVVEAACWERALIERSGVLRHPRVALLEPDPGPSAEAMRAIARYQEINRAIRRPRPEAPKVTRSPSERAAWRERAVAEAMALRDDGLTLAQVAEELNASGIPAPTVAGWSRGSVVALLRRAEPTDHAKIRPEG